MKQCDDLQYFNSLAGSGLLPSICYSNSYMLNRGLCGRFMQRHEDDFANLESV